MKRNRYPSRTRRGLGLFDSILAFAVLSVTLLWGTQIVGNWISGKIISNDARSVAELARAGRLLIEGDVNHPARGLADDGTAAPVSYDSDLTDDSNFTDLENAGLRSRALGDISPGRRNLSLHFYRPTAGVLLVIARARGANEINRIPGAEDGVSAVGVLLEDEDDGGTEHLLRGPGVNYDMFDINALTSRFATKEDIFALDNVALDVSCRSYVYRTVVDCDSDGSPDPEANTMATDLNLGDNNITEGGQITAVSAQIGRLQGTTQVGGALTVEGDLEVTGDTTLSGDLEIPGSLTAPNITVGDNLTVTGDLTAEGDLTGANLTFTGEATVSGDARIGKLNITSMTTTELKAQRIDLGTGTFTEVFADDVTVTNCTGCN